MYSKKLFFHCRIYIKALCLEPLYKLHPLTTLMQIRDTDESRDKISPKHTEDGSVLIATAKKMVSEIMSQKIFCGKK